MDAAQRRRFERLVSALCDGVIDAQQHAELEQRLRDSAECRAIYLQYVDMHARLSAHPHLSTGLPLAPNEPDKDAVLAAGTPSDTAIDPDDEIVLELARASLDRLAENARGARRQSRVSAVGRWLSLGLVVVIAVLGWQAYEHWRDIADLPVVAQIDGLVEIVSDNGVSPARVGQQLHRGERLCTGEEDARAVLRYDDGTRIIVGSNSAVEAGRENDVHLRLVSGAMEVAAAPQRPEEPLVFATDHARYVVLGTRFRLYRESAASRLELDEGKVRLERQVDGKAVDVEAGYVAVTTAESTPLEVQPLPTARADLLASLRKAGQAVTFSADGKLLATGDWERGLKTWIPGDTAPVDSYEGKIGRSSGLAFADGTLVQIGNDNRRDPLVLWRVGDKTATSFPLSGEDARSRAIAPDASCVAESDNAGTHVYAVDPSGPNSPPKLRVDLPGKGKAWCLALSQEGRFAAAGFWDGTLRVYDVAALQRGDADPSDAIVFQHKLMHTPTEAALTADGRQLAVFSRKDGLLLVDLESGERRAIWAAGAASVTCVKFTPDDKLIAGLSDGTARMWSVSDGGALLVIEAGHVPRDIAWSPEASLLATAAGKVNLWQCDLP
jgi:hypothetical protein